MAYDCVVIGAGMSGLTASRQLEDRGRSVVVLDKSRGVGGRMATRRRGEAWFDHGAQYITARSEAFREAVREAERAGWVREWHRTESGHPRYRGVPSMTAWAKGLEGSLEVRRGQRVERVERGDDGLWLARSGSEVWRGRSLLVTAPVGQALELLEKSGYDWRESFGDLERVRYEKSFALMLELDGPSGLGEPGFRRFDDPEPIETMADNQLKGVSRCPAVTALSGPEFAERHFEEEPERVQELLTDAAREHLSARVVAAALHRWRYARCVNPLGEGCRLAERDGLCLAGDGFGRAQRLEETYLSGLKAGQVLAGWLEEIADS